MAGESLVAERRETALQAERHTRAVEQNAGLEAFAKDTRRLQQVDEADRPFERNGMERDERLFTRQRLHVFEFLVLVIDQEVALLVGWQCHGGHERSSL